MFVHVADSAGHHIMQNALNNKECTYYKAAREQQNLYLISVILLLTWRMRIGMY